MPCKNNSVHTRVEENPGEFRVDNDVLFCNFCDHSIDWKQKSTVIDHLNSKGHKSNKDAGKNKLHQQTIAASLSFSESKKLF
ncbi:24032_t:CDS:2, partial [Gigaspora rosea]